MSATSDLAAAIAASVPNIKRGSLVVFGDIFGGRIDNIHIVTAARSEGDPERLTIEFDGGETLEVWDPEGATIGPDEFSIQTASKVRWEWFYYGRPQTPENRFFIEHVRSDDAVAATTNATWGDRTFAARAERPAVELVGMF